MPSGCEKARCTAEIDSVYSVAELLGLISNSCGLYRAEKLIIVLQLGEVPIQAFSNKIKAVVDYYAILSSEEHSSLTREGFGSIDQKDSEAGDSKAVSSKRKSNMISRKK